MTTAPEAAAYLRYNSDDFGTSHSCGRGLGVDKLGLGWKLGRLCNPHALKVGCRRQVIHLYGCACTCPCRMARGIMHSWAHLDLAGCSEWS